MTTVETRHPNSRSLWGYLGNTPTIARKSYIDPRVIDAYESGTTIHEAAAKTYRTSQSRQKALEEAVLDLLS